MIRGHSDERTPCDQETFSQCHIFLTCFKEHVMKGHFLRDIEVSFEDRNPKWVRTSNPLIRRPVLLSNMSEGG